jgi:large subunit ribosomal protein L7/L12
LGCGREEEVEQTEFNVVVTDHGAKKIQVIKALRKLTNLDLKSSKALLEQGYPAVVQEKLSRDMADASKKTLEESGATVEIK